MEHISVYFSLIQQCKSNENNLSWCQLKQSQETVLRKSNKVTNKDKMVMQLNMKKIIQAAKSGYRRSNGQNIKKTFENGINNDQCPIGTVPISFAEIHQTNKISSDCQDNDNFRRKLIQKNITQNGRGWVNLQSQRSSTNFVYKLGNLFLNRLVGW